MSTGHFFGVRYHRQMLQDAVRTGSYQRALEQLIRPGDVVVDVGAGTGVMSIFAARAGARHVYAIESTPIARLARRIISDNGLSEAITVLEADAATVALPEPADVLVSECMGSFVYSDAMLGVLATCRRLLAPGGRVCPSRITTFLAPTFLAPVFGEFAWWDKPRYGIDFSSARISAVNDTYPVQCPSPQLLSAPPAHYGDIFPTQPVALADQSVVLRFEREGPVDTVLGWFDAELAPDVLLQTGPGHSTHWGQLAFPVPPFVAQPGGMLHFHLTVVRGVRDLPTYAWWGVYRDPEGREQIRFERGQDLRFAPEAWAEGRG